MNTTIDIPDNQDETNNKKIFDSLLEKQEVKTLSEREKIELEIIRELNIKHAIVHTSQMYVLTEKCDHKTKETTFCLETKQSFTDTYENKMAYLPKEMGNGIETKPKAKLWLRHPNRREFLGGITFDPTHVGHTATQYNIWKGFAIKPIPGNCDKFLRFVREIICCNDEKKFTYVINWMASLIQYPDRVGTALLLTGLQGIGKNFFVETLGYLLGQHFIQLSSLKELVGNFNSHLQNAVLIHANEAIWGGNKSDLGKVKSMITEKYVLIESKGKDTIQVRNYRHLIFSSNEDWPVSIDPDDRRFMILNVSPKMKENSAYFGDIANELQTGGYEALLSYLLAIDLSEVNMRAIPESNDAFEIKLKSAGDCARYIYEVLLHGCFDVGNATPLGNWSDVISKDSVRADCRAWCEKEGIKPFTSQTIGINLKKYTSAGNKKRRSGEERIPSYEWRSLEEARKAFEKAFKVDSEVWE